MVDGDEGRHAVTVRRLRAGEPVWVGDGAGRLAVGHVAEVRGKDQLLVAVDEARAESAPTPRVTVVQALIKGERMDRAIEALTEVGADRIVPWAADNCVARLSPGGAGVAKLRRRAREASKQARRAFACEVAEVADTVELLGLVEPADGAVRLVALAGGAAPTGRVPAAIVLHESAGESLADLTRRWPDEPPACDVIVVVGPEGGLTATELAALTAAGARAARMGPTVMRANTAGTAALGAIMASSGRWP